MERAMSKQECKLFIGGLSWETSDSRLRTYFENYGQVNEAFVSYDRHTGRPRGFGFVVFEDPAVAEKVVSLQHTIDRREVEAKKAVPKEDQPAGKQANGLSSQRTKKIFVGGLAPSVDEHAFRKYFEQYGPVEDAVVMYDHDNKRPRGFGFVTFVSEESVDSVFMGGSLQTLHDKPIEIKRAVPRDQIATARGRPAYPSSPRMFTQGGRVGIPQSGFASAQSGFAAAALNPAFGGDTSPLGAGLLNAHSLGAPMTQARVPSLTGAASLGAQGLPTLPHDMRPMSQGLAANLLSAMSGNLGHMGNGMQGMASAGSGMLQGNYSNPGITSHMGGSTDLGYGNDYSLSQLNNQMSNQMSGQLPRDLTGQMSSQLSGQLPNHYEPSANQMARQLSGQLPNHIQSNQMTNQLSGQLPGHYEHGQMSTQLSGHLPNHIHPGGNFSSAASNGLMESAFSGMNLESAPSFSSDMHGNSAFDRPAGAGSLLSAGSAGLGQLPSPSQLKPESAFSSGFTPISVPQQTQNW